MPEGDDAALRVAVVAADQPARAALLAAVERAPGLQAIAWADSAEALLVLDTRADVCLCDRAPPPVQAARLADRGCQVVVVQPGADPVETLRRARVEHRPGTTLVRPDLAPRQLEVLLAYVSTNDVQAAVARSLGMDPETLRTHLRRIRAKYADAGRPAPTRRDLYVRALEDGLLPPPSPRR
ncbi:response regulator transcription factor [Geodermatophilus sp. URMC 61]|uniref:response regulator transcription factor n=1 Tax=Geodermatophilus sp. URMC 61 TaxID=3423411 RepID=UPI00406C7556